MASMRIALACAILGMVNSAAVNTTSVNTCMWQECDAPCGGGNRVCDRTNGAVWNIDCHMQDCASVASCGNADVVFVLDSSNSISEKNWWKAKQFVIDVSKGLNVSPTETRIGVVSYSNSGVKNFVLAEFNSIAEVEENIWTIEHLAGNTNTYEGLLYAAEIMDNFARPEVKHIVIVITDGKSNNQASKTIPQAEEMHLKGIEIFAVGVSADVDTDEINGIASQPTAVHAHYVNDYDALRTITNTIINGTCEAAKSVECDAWSNWSDCLFLPGETCGEGLESRFRWCRFFLYPGSPPDTRIHTETKICSKDCRPRCARCDFRQSTVGYMQDEENCHKFIQCVKIGDQYMEYEHTCGALYWKQAWKTCVWDLDPTYTCIDAPVVAPTTTTTTTAAPPVCDKTAVANDLTKYVWSVGNGISHTMSCPYGTVFRAGWCTCLPGVNNPKCNSETVVHFPFNEHTDDICNRAVGERIGNVIIDDNAAYFDGSSRVEIPMLDTWAPGGHVSEVTLSLWFRYTGSNNDTRGMFSNGDCVDDASLLASIGSGSAQGQVIAGNTKAQFTQTGSTRSFKRDEWTYITIVKNKETAKYYVNGELKQEENAEGFLANTQCPANIGFDYSNQQEHFFEGYIDDVRIYKDARTEAQIEELFKAGRQ